VASGGSAADGTLPLDVGRYLSRRDAVLALTDGFRPAWAK